MRLSGRDLCKSWQVLIGLGWLALIAAVPITSWPWISDQITNYKSEDLQKWGWYFLGVGIAPLTLLLTHNRTRSLKMQTDALRVQTDTDVFTKSIKLLGDKQAAVRQGGIYSLGGIAKDNPERHSTIIRIMTSYIRGETYRKFHERFEEESLTKEDKENLISKLVNEEEPMSSDIEAAIEVIRERKVHNDKPLRNKENQVKFNFDLSNSYIRNADFSCAKLPKTNFSDSIILRCSFDDINFQKSLFVKSVFKKCEFENANLMKCDFEECDLSGSEFRRYDPDERINTQKSDLRGSSFIKATLKNCEFKNTNFHECDFEKCNLSGSKFENCDLADARNLTPKQINSVREIDENTYKKLPDHLKESAIPKIQNNP